nr:MAG TPA_asm: glycoside hydrolase family protein [Caudoviricetes sp.]
MAKADKLEGDLDEHNYVADYIYGKNHGHVIGFSWTDNKLNAYVDGRIVRSW